MTSALFCIVLLSNNELGHCKLLQKYIINNGLLALVSNSSEFILASQDCISGGISVKMHLACQSQQGLDWKYGFISPDKSCYSFE